jgi:hypothetical protein
MAKRYIVHSKVWLWPGDTRSTSSGQVAAWHFVNVDKKQSAELKEKFGKKKRGFGSIPVTVTIGKTRWQTSIFPDKRSETYLLPLKAQVRRAEGVDAGDMISFTLAVRA